MSSLAKLSPALHATPVTRAKCRLCRCKLESGGDHDFSRELCGSCKLRPEARRLGIVGPLSPARVEGINRASKSAPSFTAAEKALIQKVHGYMPAQQLLGVLNERLACNLGPDAVLYTMDQLYAEIGDASGAVPDGGHDWASLRKLLARAQEAGVLDAITEQVINDFAVVFSLNQKQVLVLKDIILPGKED